MLTLTKKENEPIICTLPNGEEIKIVVTKVNGNQTKVSIDASDDVFILREELLIESD